MTDKLKSPAEFAEELLPLAKYGGRLFEADRLAIAKAVAARDAATFRAGVRAGIEAAEKPVREEEAAADKRYEECGLSINALDSRGDVALGRLHSAGRILTTIRALDVEAVAREAGR